jgi:hypothetical protein
MVKDSKTKAAKPGPLPRPKRGRPFSGEEPRDHRLMMRVNQSLSDLCDIRAAERGESRSRFIERLLLAYLKLDPRNPRLDQHGRILTDGPAVSRAGDPVGFGAAWSRWVALNENLFQWKPGDDLRDEPADAVLLRRGGRPLQPDEDD